MAACPSHFCLLIFASQVYVWGLFLDGAAWDEQGGVLVDQPPKQLFCAIPIMFVTALEKKEKERVSASQVQLVDIFSRCPDVFCAFISRAHQFVHD